MPAAPPMAMDCMMSPLASMRPASPPLGTEIFASSEPPEPAAEMLPVERMPPGPWMAIWFRMPFFAD